MFQLFFTQNWTSISFVMRRSGVRRPWAAPLSPATLLFISELALVISGLALFISALAPRYLLLNGAPRVGVADAYQP